MKDIRNNPLFTDMTAEEEVSVQGGNPAVLLALGTGAAWALDKLEGIWLNTNFRSGAELTGGVYGPSGGNKQPRDQNQAWEIQWFGNTFNGYGRTFIQTLLRASTAKRMYLHRR